MRRFPGAHRTHVNQPSKKRHYGLKKGSIRLRRRITAVPHLIHETLMAHSKQYARFHAWSIQSPGRRRAAITVPMVVIVGLVSAGIYSQTYAVVNSQTWNFSNASDFLFDNSKLEVNNTSVQLKAQNYNTDPNTVGLYHFDETSGSAAIDASSSANNGQLRGAALFNPAHLNNGLSLGGSGDYVSVADSPSLTLSGQQTLEGWTKFNNGFTTDAGQDQGVIDKGSYRLYYDRTSGKVNYEIASNNATQWTRQAGTDTNGSWDTDGKTVVRSTVVSGGNTYVGLGLGVGDAEVWKWNGTTWSQIGGDGLNSGWSDQVFEDVNGLAVVGTTLYAGLGTNAAGDAEVWSCNMATNCTNWSKIGGDGANGSWAASTFESVQSLSVLGSTVYVGLGAGAGDAEVWTWSGSAWSKIGGDGVNSSWNAVYESVQGLEHDGTNTYVGLGTTAGDGEVWKWNGTTWSQIGGDGMNGSWAASPAIEYVASLSYFGGSLYVGTAVTAGDGDVWKYNGTTWSQIGGDGLNGGWAASAYEIVSSLSNDGTSLFAGLGSTTGDGEVYQWNGTAWTKIGGDGVNGSWPAAQGDGVYSLANSGGKLYAGVHDTNGDGTFWLWNGTDWTRLGGGYVNNSWGYYGINSVESSTTLHEKLYVGTGVSAAGNAMVWEFDGSQWRVIGGQGLNGSWLENTYENVYTLQSYKGQLYAGLGTTASDAEVWRWNGTTWSQVGGDGLNNSWGAGFEAVQVLSVYNGDLYAGLGNSANDAEVWRYDGTAWTKIGGDSINSGWTVGYEAVLSMTIYNGDLYAGVGVSVNEAEVWKWSGAAWSKVGGDGVSGSWNTSYEEVFIMRVYQGKLIAGLGAGAGDAEIWAYDGTDWSQIGGDAINESWVEGTYERIRSMAIYNGELYAGLGDNTGDGEVWKYNGSEWSKVGGNSINNGWTNAVEYVSTLIDYKGRLYAGTGASANVDAAVWSLGNNSFLSSSQSAQDNNWHHLAASYDGTTMKLFIDGQLDSSLTTAVTVTDNALPLLIGATQGSSGRGESQGYFNGQIDEVRLSNTARSSFTTKPYVTAPEAVTLVNAVFKTDTEAYSGFTTSETTNGGSVKYQLSSDGGANWEYWNGTAWAGASSLANANSQSDIDAHISSFPVTFDGLKWRAITESNGDQRVALNSVTVHAVEDISGPSSNAENIIAKRSVSGSALNASAWTNGASPHFSWDSAADSGAGVYGYCLYLGQDASSNVATSKGILGTSPVATGDHCQFITTQTSIDLSVSNMLASALETSTTPYHLRIKAIDKAGNLTANAADFTFYFDNTPPENPGFISSPSGFINSKTATMTWSTSGDQAASDDASGLAGLQYRIGNSSWYGDAHDGTGSMSDLLANDGSYTTTETPDFANIADGTNTVYFRTWDIAGNVTTSYVSAALKINTNGAPSEPQNLVATPPVNTSNNFSFSWDAPVTFVGSQNTLNYCYTINVVPSASNCNFAGTGVHSLASGAYASQPGTNTIYVVARDESGSINYSNYATATFSANTAAPGISGNLDIVDVSIKISSKWRLAITWDVPVSNGDAVSVYKIYRSTNGTTFNLAGTSSSTTFIDAGLSQSQYYYRVKACDNTNNCSADSSVVSLTPTGKFTEAANLVGQPEVSNTTTKRAKISWVTDRGSDSKIALGTASGNYGSAEIGNSDQVSAHAIDLDNLAAGTTYYYVVKWTDIDGNTGVSQEYTFRTSPAPVLKEVNTAKVGLSDAIISFTSLGANKVNLYFGASDSFGGLKTINTSVDESSYSMSLDGLSDGVKYYYQLAAVDSEGTEYKGNVFSFTTPQRPRISNLRFQPVADKPTSTQSVIWTTNVPSTSTITYGKLGTAGTDIQDSKMTTDHTLVVSGLEDDSQYFLVAQSRDSAGNLAVSDRQIFKTALDTRPPTVSDISIESSIRGSGSEARGQIIISWKTDELSTSQVGYADGSGATVFNNKSSEEVQLATEHIVILSNLPTSKVYSIQVMSYDKGRNLGVGETQTAIIGRANESVLTLIINSLQRIFGL